jgi:hypothetical protein
VRGAGGWSAVKMLRKSGLFQKSGERILGEGDFVESVLHQANEKLEHTQSLKYQGYDFQTIIQLIPKSETRYSPAEYFRPDSEEY